MFKKDRNIIIFLALLILRIPLSHIIGDNGIGYLSGPMEAFVLFALLGGTGLIHTMQGMMRDRVRRDQYRNAEQVYKLARRIAICYAIILLIINVLLYDFVCTKLLCDGGQRLAYLFVGPAIAISIFLSLNKGYLLGTENTGAVVLGEIFESVCIIATCIIGAILGQRYGLKIAALLHYEDVAAMYGAMGVMIGLVVGKFIALIAFSVMVLIYKRTFRHLCKSDASRRMEYTSEVTGSLVSGMLMDGGHSMLLQLIIIISLIVYRRYGIKNDINNVNSMVGAFYGKFLSISGILSGLCVTIVPTGLRGVIAANSEGEDYHAAERMGRLLSRLLYAAIPMTIFTMMMIPAIMSGLFKGMITTVTGVLAIGSLVIVVYSVMYVFMALLIQLNYQREVLFMSFLTFVVSLVFLLFFIRNQGKEFVAMALAILIFYSLNAILCLFVSLRNIKIRINLVQSIVLPLVISGVIGLLIKLLSGVLIGSVGGILTLFICLIPAWIIYNIACMFLHVVSAGQMEKKLFGRMWIMLGQNLGIY